MITERNKTHTGFCKWAIPVVCVVAILLVSGCVNSYGRLTRDPEVATAFKTNRAFENHTYYYRNWLGEPIAVIGIRQGYTLDSDLWFEVDLNEVSIQTLWDRMSIRDPSLFYGSKLLDPAGNEMGIWFSDYEGATIKMTSATVIDFITPYGIPRYGDDDSVRPQP